MKFYLSLFAILFCFSQISCKSTENSSESTEKPKTEETPATEALASDDNQELPNIIGQWNWIKTNCCGRMSKDRLASEQDKIIFIEFTANGRALHFEDGIETDNQSYELKIGGVFPDRPMVQIGSTPTALVQLNGDTLILNRGYMDLQIEYYKRK